MSFDGLRPILAKNGLSEVGTLGELSSRAAKVLEGRIKAVAGGGVLSKFGEKAARILFRMADRVRLKGARVIFRSQIRDQGQEKSMRGTFFFQM